MTIEVKFPKMRLFRCNFCGAEDDYLNEEDRMDCPYCGKGTMIVASEKSEIKVEELDS